MAIFSKFLNNFVDKVSAKVTTEVNKKLETDKNDIAKSREIQGLSLDPNKLFYRTTEKGLRKPTSITFETLRRMAKAVHIARVCINTLKHRVSQTKWDIIPIDEDTKPDRHHINILKNFFNNPNRQETFRTFLDGFLEDLLVLDAGVFEKIENNAGLPAEIWYVDGATVKPNFDLKGIFQNPAYYQYISSNSTEPDAEWERKDLVYVMQNPQRDSKNYGYGLAPLEGVIMVATNMLNADNYMGQFFDIGTLPPKLINLGKDVSNSEVELFRAYWKAEIEGRPWKTAIYGGGELTTVDMSSGMPVDMQFQQYQIWLMKIICAAFEVSPQDIGFTAELKMGGLGGGSVANVQKDISDSKGYRSLLQLTREVFNRDIVKNWFGFDDVKFDWIGIDALQPKEAAEIFDIEVKNGAVSINEYRIQKGLKPIVGGVKPQIVTPSGIFEVDATPLEDVSNKEIDEEKEEEVGKKYVEKKVYAGDFICWMDDRGFGQPFIWTDKFGKLGYVIKPPVAVNINGIDIEEKWTHIMAENGLNVNPVDIVAAVDIDQYLPTAELRKEFRKYQNMTPEYYSKKWEMRFGNSRKYEKYTVVKYIDGRCFTDQTLVDDMKRVPGEYEKAVKDLATLYKFEKENGMGDRRANQYIITPDKRGWGLDYQFVGSDKAWEKYKYSIPKNLEAIPRLKQIFEQETGLSVEGLKKNVDSEIRKERFDINQAKEIIEQLDPDWRIKYSIDEFVLGLNEELEHRDITDGDPILTGKIALSHLKEKPDYYTRLNEMMNKSVKKKVQKSREERSKEEQLNFWHKKVGVVEDKMVTHLMNQSKALKGNMARVVRDELVARKAIPSDQLLQDAASEVPETDIGLKYSKSMNRFYKTSFELGIDNFLKKAEDKLKDKGVTREMMWDIIGKAGNKKTSKAIERSGIYDKLKVRGTNMITTVLGNKQTKLVDFIRDKADQGKNLNEISDEAMDKFSLPLEEFEVKRIASTETAWAANQGSLEAGRELGIDKFEVLLDPDACEICQGAYGDGEVMSEKDLAGVGEPPLHPNCQCVIEPFIDEDNLDDIAENIASQYEDL